MKYKLSAGITVSAYTTVEANSPEEAIAIAKDREAAIGNERCGNDPEELWIIEEADGMAQGIIIDD